MIEPVKSLVEPTAIVPKDKGIGIPKDWLNLAMGGGSALIAHSIASSIFDKPESERRKDSIWSKVLAALIPIGIGAAGGYGGYKLSEKLFGNQNTKSAQVRTNDWTRLTSDSGNIRVDVPKEYEGDVEKLLDLLSEEKNESGIDSIDALKERADEIAKRNEGMGIQRGISKALPFAEATTGGKAFYDMSKGGWKMYTSRPTYISSKAQDIIRASAPAPHPGPQPNVMDSKYYGKPELFRQDMLRYRDQLAKFQRDSMPEAVATRNRTNAAIINKAKLDIAESGKGFREGVKSFGKGTAWGLGTIGLDYLRGLLNEKIQKADNDAEVGRGFGSVYDRLYRRLQSAVPVDNQGK